MDKHKQVRVGLVGAGAAGIAHAQAYRAVGDPAVLTAIADTDLAAATALAGTDSGVRTYPDLARMLAAEELDLVDICLPHHLHTGAVVAALEAGTDVICEKPLCASMAELKEITVATAARPDRMVMCAQNRLYSPAVVKAAEMIRSDALGPVHDIQVVDSFASWATAETIGWRGSLAEAGGGELFDTGYHPTYTLLHLAGSPPRQVFGMLSNHRLDFLTAEDSAQLLVRFDSGLVGVVTSSWAYERAPGGFCFFVSGERGALWGDASRIVHRPKGEAEIVHTLPTGQNEFELQIRDFLRCVVDRCEPAQPLAGTVDVVKVILGAYESAATGRLVSVPDMS